MARKSEKTLRAFFSAFLIVSMVFSQVALPLVAYATEEPVVEIQKVLEEPQPIVVVPQTATINAQKVVCNSEDDLPNWGAGGPNITATTASDFITAHPNCHLENWEFAWSGNGVGNAGPGGIGSGDNVVGTRGNPWTTFNNSTNVPAGNGQRIWFREQFRDGYIPFTGWLSNAEYTNTPTTEDAISAEFYCATDVYNYDNWDFIDTVPGETYYCVGFNVPLTPPLQCDPEVNLLANGSFETPSVSPGNYGIFPQATLGLEWLVDWVNALTAGIPGLEIQDNVAGAPASGSGDQFAELDGNHPVKIWQDIPTIPGKEYKLSFKYSPRPGAQSGTNMLEARADGALLGAVLSGVGGVVTNWTSENRTFIADANTKIEFVDTDNDNSYGGYLDDVSLTCLGDPAPQCIEDASSVIVSDSTTMVGANNAVPVGFIHGAWAASIPGATWIWSDVNVVDATVDTTKTFTKTFSVVGTPLNSTLLVAADNNYDVYMNGIPVAGAGCSDVTGATFGGAQICIIPAAMMTTGTNTLAITVRNWAVSGSDYNSNPAGLLYKLTLNNNECVTPEPTGSIEITKYICPANFVPNRTDNGVGSVAPEGCTLAPDVAFGYVHGVQTDANGPYPELDAPLIAGGTTAGNGKLVIAPVVSAGRYLIKETDATNLAGLYCQGDGDINPNNNDNQELTFVPAGGVAKCVAYNKTTVLGETASNNTTVVKAADLAADIPAVIATPTKWFFYNDETDIIDNALGSFVTGPASAPVGTGSAQMSVTGTQRRNIATYQFKDVKLADIKTLSFSTYSQLAGDGALGLSERAPYLHFNVDFNNSDTWQKRLVYVPAQNGVVAPDVWQTWDAINSGNALWVYSGATWPTTLDAGTTPKTWSQILALYPNAETRSTDSWFGFRVGEPYADGFTGNVDKFMMGIKTGLNTHTETYDFEPTAVVVNPACSDDGDNDEDGLVDANDPGCHSDGNASNSESYVPSDNDESNPAPTITTFGGGGGGGGSRSLIGGGAGPSTGSVLGASTSCGIYLNDFLKMGWKNKIEQVKKLQTFLNDYLKLDPKLPVTGIFGMQTYKAVLKFQEGEETLVLKPWVGVTLKDSKKGTGFVYKTTITRINNIMCPELNIPVPPAVLD